MQGNPAANNIKWGMRALGVAMVPMTASLPQGVFVYWITSNVVSCAQTLGACPPALRPHILSHRTRAALKSSTIRSLTGIPLATPPAGAAGGVGGEQQPAVPLLLNKPRRKGV